MFRGKLWKKLLITFLILSVAVIILINYPMKSWIEKNIRTKYTDEMKIVANNVSNEYLNSFESDEEITLAKFGAFLNSVQSFTKINFILTNMEGRINFTTDLDELEGVNVLEHKADFYDNRLYKSTDIGGILDGKHLVYIYQVNYQHQQLGYEILYVSCDEITGEAEDYLFWANIVGMVFIIVFFAVMIFYSVYYTKVLKTLIKRTVAYTDERFEQKGKIMKIKDEHQELMNAIDCLGEKNEGLIEYQKNFVANISHDFRSPLTSIRGYTVAIKDGTIPYEALGKYLDIIIFETDRLTGLTQNILQLSEFDNKAIKLDYRRIDICALLKQSAATFEAICASKKIKMRLVFAEKEIFVNCDVSKIQQVVHNLIDNAIKFSNEEGLIVLTVAENETKVFVSVKDNGIGIPPNAVNHIWERFYKTDLSRGKDKKGTGLGLSITKQIINAHGEKIGVESKVGEGTEFTFSLSKASK